MRVGRQLENRVYYTAQPTFGSHHYRLDASVRWERLTHWMVRARLVPMFGEIFDAATLATVCYSSALAAECANARR